MAATNQATIAARLKADLGLTDAQTAGVLGNLQTESNFNPGAYNAGEGAIGLAQWEGGRRTALDQYAARVGGAEQDLNTQIGFLEAELTGNYSGALANLKATSTPAAAAQVVQSQYEISAPQSLGQRQANANAIFAAGVGGGAAGSSAPATGPPTARNYFTAFLTKLGITPNDQNIAALESVQHYEGNNNRYNPLNVIQPEPGSTNYNSVGVQTYADFQSGVQGAVDLFQGSHWDGVRAALATGNEGQILQAFDAGYTWSPGTNIPALSGQSLAQQDQTLVGGKATDQVKLTGISSLTSSIPIPGTGISIPGIPNPIDIVTQPVKDVITYVSTVTHSIVNFFIDSFVVIVGVLFLIMALYLFAKGNDADDAGDDQAAPAAPSKADDAAAVALA